MKLIAAALVAALAGPSLAQTPDVAPFLELHPSWQVRNKKSLFNWYDPSGRYSLVGLRMLLETGYRVYVAQRFQRVDNSGDPDTLDEYYIESRGHWRIGKQYLPFGRREIIRSSVLGARLDTNLLLDEAPISIAACDGGSGRTRGVFGRINGAIGLSFAVGNHIGIQATDMTRFRDLETAPGIGRGHRLALGADTAMPLGSAQLTAEWVSFRRGETNLDIDRDVSELRLRLPTHGPGDRASVSWSRDWTERQDHMLFEIQFASNERVSFLPMVRFEGFGFKDFALTAVMRL
ncbi:MAG: hypothetical protein JSS66_00315 [Armatimonadetes bacterium]|nr:hypothetical protein [Armatimonadota bacterium]